MSTDSKHKKGTARANVFKSDVNDCGKFYRVSLVLVGMPLFDSILNQKDHITFFLRKHAHLANILAEWWSIISVALSPFFKPVEGHAQTTGFGLSSFGCIWEKHFLQHHPSSNLQ